MKTKLTTYTSIVFALILALWFMQPDPPSYDSYCMNVKLYDYDASHGVAVSDRAGHPDYKNIGCHVDDEEFEQWRKSLNL